MKDEVTNALAVLIESIVQGKDFVLSQAPEVIQQLLAYEIMNAWVWVIALGLLTLAGIYGAYELYAWEDSDEGDGDTSLATIIGSTIVGLCLAMLTAATMDLIKLHIAPKVWLIEYAAELVK